MVELRSCQPSVGRCLFRINFRALIHMFYTLSAYIRTHSGISVCPPVKRKPTHFEYTQMKPNLPTNGSLLILGACCMHMPMYCSDKCAFQCKYSVVLEARKAKPKLRCLRVVVASARSRRNIRAHKDVSVGRCALFKTCTI